MKKPNKERPLVHLTKKDFEVQYFRAGGSGGQNQNKVSSACRIIHKESGAVGECRNFRDQPQNRKAAFHRLVESKKFQCWLKIENAARLKGFQDLEKQLDDMMKPENLTIEYYDPDKKGK